LRSAGAHPVSATINSDIANDDRSPSRGGQLPAPLAFICRCGRHGGRRPLGLGRSRPRSAAPERPGEEEEAAEGSASEGSPAGAP